MAWPSKPDPKEIIGMSPDELKAKLDAGVTKDDLTNALEEISAKQASGLNELKQALAKLTTPPPAAEEPLPDPTDDTTRMLTDPTGFVKKEMKPAMDAAAETQAQVQEMRARQDPRFTELFRQYGTEMVKLGAGFPAAQRANPGFWGWHVRTYLGDKMLKEEIKPSSYPSLIGSSSVAPATDGNDKDPNF